MEWRGYQPETDREAVHRIWREVGWLPPKNEQADKALDAFLEGNRPIVALLNNSPECCVLSGEGSLRYQKENIPFSAITAVTTSAIARRRGFAKRLTTQGVLRGVESGALVTGLGIFDQGFYDGLGFGALSYMYEFDFDPASLLVNDKVREPIRIGVDEGEPIHEARCNRLWSHGGVSLDHPCQTLSDLVWRENSYGLGYKDGPSGEISHYIWCHPEQQGETTILRISLLVYKNREQLMELLGLIKQQADQVVLVNMMEPPGVQLQDLLERPFRHRNLTKGGKAANNAQAYACFQMRMNDIPGCLEQTRLYVSNLRFNLQVTDPIAPLLADHDGWRGVAGDYVVTLGERSNAEPGHDPQLPTLKASVNAFTRLWLGVRPATALSYTDDLTASPALLMALDETLRLPTPCTGWMF